MTSEEKSKIHTSLNEMLANPKSKNFINHLIRAYMPISNVTKVWEKPKGDFKCVLTRNPLISTDEILEGINGEEFKNTFINSLKIMFDEKPDTKTAMETLLAGKQLGITGKDTTTFMSYPAFQEFYDWVVTKALHGDKHINWLLGSIRRASFIDRAENISDKTVQDKVFKFKKKNETAKVATFTLGESSDLLSKLKADLEAKGN